MIVKKTVRPSKVQNVEECDATEDDNLYKAGNKNIKKFL